MPDWLRRSLYGIMLVSCLIIGMRVYLGLNTTSDAPATGAVSSTSLPEQLPDFVLNDVRGEPRSIREWAGKPLLINFWATWCAPCRREMPLLQALHSSQNQLQVLGIAIDRQSDVQSYLAEAGISYPSLVGETDAIAVSDLFGLNGLGLPFSVLVGSQGEILTVFVGEIDARQLETMAAISLAFNKQEIALVTAQERLNEL
jgi:thiol-disulfide isomerase/thioredoxin